MGIVWRDVYVIVYCDSDDLWSRGGMFMLWPNNNNSKADDNPLLFWNFPVSVTPMERRSISSAIPSFYCFVIIQLLVLIGVMYWLTYYIIGGVSPGTHVDVLRSSSRPVGSPTSSAASSVYAESHHDSFNAATIPLSGMEDFSNIACLTRVRCYSGEFIGPQSLARSVCYPNEGQVTVAVFLWLDYGIWLILFILQQSRRRASFTFAFGETRTDSIFGLQLSKITPSSIFLEVTFRDVIRVLCLLVNRNFKFLEFGPQLPPKEGKFYTHDAADLSRPYYKLSRHKSQWWFIQRQLLSFSLRRWKMLWLQTLLRFTLRSCRILWVWISITEIAEHLLTRNRTEPIFYYPTELKDGKNYKIHLRLLFSTNLLLLLRKSVLWDSFIFH